MAKIKPNVPCPCNSGVKYKKCCSLKEQRAKLALAIKLDEKIMDNEIIQIETYRLKKLNNYILDRYKVQSVDITNIVDQSNIKQICGHYFGKNIVLMLIRTETTESTFIEKNAKYQDNGSDEDTMLIYKNNYIIYNDGFEHDEALKNIETWLGNKKKPKPTH